MTAAKVMDVIARLLDCDGQAADAVSAYTLVKMEDAPILLRIPKSECPDVWIRLPRHKKKGKNLGLPFWRSSGSSWTKFAWLPRGRNWWQTLSLTNQLHFLITWFTQRECKPNATFVDEYRENVRITNFCWSDWNTTRAGKASRKDGCVVLRYGRTCSKMRWKNCEVANKETELQDKVSSTCLDDHHSKKEELEPVGEWSKVCSQIFLKCVYLSQVGRPDFFVVSEQICSISH